ncbi:MAG: GTP-binding protein [Planctomycetes bacterium]|nr:GTP-binding protein [Planctomycetota bacterium]
MSTTLSMQSAMPAYKAPIEKNHSRPMLRLMTCGSVDDGKSTLIGQLLLRTGSIHEDQVEALRRETEKHGTAGVSLDPALLLDGLEDERKQGITIDVAYRYFQTRKRKFIIADSPGHEQYTRNMATAASVSDVAIILVDARKGLLPQTCRHSYIASLMGIRHVILAINKMDLVDYQQSVFESLMENYHSFSSNLGFLSLHGIPISGLHADNMVSLSPKTPWFKGRPLLELLETIGAEQSKTREHLRFPVQRVCRPNLDFRGYSGTVVAGTISVGERVRVLPGGGETKIKSIVTMDGCIPFATAGSPVTLTLENELDLSRGDMIADAEYPPMLSNAFQSMLVWMSPTPMDLGVHYLLRNGCKWTRAEIKALHHRVDVKNLVEHPALTLHMNEIGLCTIHTRDFLTIDSYLENRSTGSLILVDPLTNETMAAGMIRNSIPAGSNSISTDPKVFNNTPPTINEKYPSFQVTGTRGMTILCLLQSGPALMETLKSLEQYCEKTKSRLLKLDTTGIMHGLCNDLGNSEKDNVELMRRVIEITKLVKNSVDICLILWDRKNHQITPEISDLVKTNLNIIIDGGDEQSHDTTGLNNQTPGDPMVLVNTVQKTGLKITSTDFSCMLASTTLPKN